MSFVKELGALPLFQGIESSRLEALLESFRTVTKPAGTILFEPGDRATTIDVLVKGEITIEEPPSGSTPANAESVWLTVRPVSLLGELSALTGLLRSSKATTASAVELRSIRVPDLLAFFEADHDGATSFHRNLLALVSDKVRRDRSRLEDMRANIVRTQKAMKQLREIVLEASETALSKPIFDTLDSLIERNRRANYRVIPTPSYPAHVRLQDGRNAEILELSEGHVKVAGKASDLTRDPNLWTGVLVIPSSEILVSGRILREGGGIVVVKLDTLMDESKAKLDDYTTRLQLLDVVL